MSKNLFPAISAVLKANKVTLEKDEFKAVLDIVNGKETTYNKELTPTAQAVVWVFDQADLEQDEFYLVQNNSKAYTTNYVAKNRTQLLDVVMNKASFRDKLQVMQFGAEFH